MKSLHQTWPALVTTIGLAAIAVLVSPGLAASQTLPTLSTVTPGQVKTPTASQPVVAPADLNPYQESKLAYVGATSCGDYGSSVCAVPFSSVPAGKRLVVEGIFGSLALAYQRQVWTVWLRKAGSTVPVAVAPALYQADNNISGTESSYTVSSKILAYFEAGETPELIISRVAPHDLSRAYVALVGHFVSVP